jgi:tRNA(Ile2) C34 agmatinyltransferase TiaS
MSHYHLSVDNAPRRCGECGERATAYVHGVGFRCGECEEVPEALRGRGGGASYQ